MRAGLSRSRVAIARGNRLSGHDATATTSAPTRRTRSPGTGAALELVARIVSPSAASWRLTATVLAGTRISQKIVGISKTSLVRQPLQFPWIVGYPSFVGVGFGADRGYWVENASCHERD